MYIANSLGQKTKGERRQCQALVGSPTKVLLMDLNRLICHWYGRKKTASHCSIARQKENYG